MIDAAVSCVGRPARAVHSAVCLLQHDQDPLLRLPGYQRLNLLGFLRRSRSRRQAVLKLIYLLAYGLTRLLTYQPISRNKCFLPQHSI